jgi:acetyl esterase/lipase
MESNRMATTTSVSIQRDVVFGTGGGRELRCNIHTPSETSVKQTALVFFHGGGFVGGTKDTIDARVGHFANLGYVCIAAEYRLSPEARWPEQIHDAKAALRWTHESAGSLGVKSDRVGIVGFSAGGLLALTCAGTADSAELGGTGGHASAASDVAVCLSYYSSIEIPRAADGEHPLMQPGADDAMFESARPTSYVTSSFAPTILFHGTGDVNIPLGSSLRFFNQLQDAGVPAEFHAIQGVPHAFDRHAELGEACASFADLFIDRHVINPRTYPPFKPGG